MTNRRLRAYSVLEVVISMALVSIVLSGALAAYNGWRSSGAPRGRHIDPGRELLEVRADVRGADGGIDERPRASGAARRTSRRPVSGYDGLYLVGVPDSVLGTTEHLIYARRP